MKRNTVIFLVVSLLVGVIVGVAAIANSSSKDTTTPPPRDAAAYAAGQQYAQNVKGQGLNVDCTAGYTSVGAAWQVDSWIAGCLSAS